MKEPLQILNAVALHSLPSLLQSGQDFGIIFKKPLIYSVLPASGGENTEKSAVKLEKLDFPKSSFAQKYRRFSHS